MQGPSALLFPLKRSSRLLQRITGRAGTVLAAVHPVHEAVGAAVVPPLRRALFLPAGGPHEKGKFRIVYRKQRVLLFLAVAALAVAVNILLLWGLEVNTVIPLYAVTLLFVLFAFVLVPFVVRYEKRLPKAQRAPKEAMGKAERKQKESAHGKPEG